MIDQQLQAPFAAVRINIQSINQAHSAALELARRGPV